VLSPVTFFKQEKTHKYNHFSLRQIIKLIPDGLIQNITLIIMQNRVITITSTIKKVSVVDPFKNKL
jgi:hypothetical protein